MPAFHDSVMLKNKGGAEADSNFLEEEFTATCQPFMAAGLSEAEVAAQVCNIY